MNESEGPPLEVACLNELERASKVQEEPGETGNGVWRAYVIGRFAPCVARKAAVEKGFEQALKSKVEGISLAESVPAV